MAFPYDKRYQIVEGGSFIDTTSGTIDLASVFVTTIGYQSILIVAVRYNKRYQIIEGGSFIDTTSRIRVLKVVALMM